MKTVVSFVTVDDENKHVEMVFHPDDFHDRDPHDRASILASMMTLIGDEMVGIIDTETNRTESEMESAA